MITLQQAIEDYSTGNYIESRGTKAKRKKNEQIFADKEEGKDYLVCKICGMKTGELTGHLLYSHKIDHNEYKKEFGLEQLKCLTLIEKVAGENNPGYNHGGRLSPFSKKFIKGDISEQTVKKSIDTRTANNNNPTTIEYWMKKTNGDEELAKELLSTRQSTFSLDKCIEKFGEIDGLKRWQDRQNKWHTNYKKSNFSKISQELFWSIYDEYDNNDCVYFAENHRIDGRKNSEYILTLDVNVIKPDFIDIDRKKIIEFDGTYWHEVQQNPRREFERDAQIIAAGYDVMHVKESDYMNNKQNVVQDCIKFLCS
jgi:hypothetical protein